MKIILLNANDPISHKLADMGVKHQLSEGKHIMMYKQKIGNAYNTYYEWRWKWIDAKIGVRQMLEYSVYADEDEFINKLKESI